MLSKLEAIAFLADVLKINDVIKLLGSSKKLQVVGVVMSAYREAEPFQNITLLAVDLKDRHRPSWTEIKHAMFQKQGGLCYAHHVFLFALFKALDFDVSLGHACVTGPGNHLVLFMKNINIEGDRHLLEAAIGYPSFRLISLDFNDESPVFIDSFLEYKYIKYGGKVMRMHRKGDIRPPVDADNSFYIDDWKDSMTLNYKKQPTFVTSTMILTKFIQIR